MTVSGAGHYYLYKSSVPLKGVQCPTPLRQCPTQWGRRARPPRGAPDRITSCRARSESDRRDDGSTGITGNGPAGSASEDDAGYDQLQRPINRVSHLGIAVKTTGFDAGDQGSAVAARIARLTGAAALRPRLAGFR